VIPPNALEFGIGVLYTIAIIGVKGMHSPYGGRCSIRQTIAHTPAKFEIALSRSKSSMLSAWMPVQRSI